MIGAEDNELQVAIVQTGGISKAFEQTGLIWPPIHLQTQFASQASIARQVNMITAINIFGIAQFTII
jgi:hypothetical protein